VNQNEITTQLLAYVRKHLATEAPDLGPDTLLFKEGHLDSTAMLELILWVEETFQVGVENEELTPENFGSARNIADFIQTKSGATANMNSTAA